MIPDDPQLKNFPLIWRFSDAVKYTQLSPQEFKRFQPLSTEASLQEWERYVYPDAGPRERHLMEILRGKSIPGAEEPLFSSVTEAEQTEVRSHLQRRIPAEDSCELLFFWDAESAVRTDWRLFLDHWDDFCYPSDDSNIAVLPELDTILIYVEDRWYILERPNGKPLFHENSRR